MSKKLIFTGVCVYFMCGLTAQSGDIKFSGFYDIQYRNGDSYKSAGYDNFSIETIYFNVEAGLADNVDGLIVLDLSDMAKETTLATHKYVEEAQIIFSKVLASPVTVIFGKDEMPYGQDYDNGLFNPLTGQLEIDKVWGVNAKYSPVKNFSIETAVWEQDSTSDLNLTQSFTSRIKISPAEFLTAQVSYANIEDPAADTESWISIGSIFKKFNFVLYGEINLLNNNNTSVGGYTLADNPSLISAGAEYNLGALKIKGRYESLVDDSQNDVLILAMAGLDYNLNKTTALMVEYQSEFDDVTNDSTNDIAFGVRAKF